MCWDVVFSCAARYGPIFAEARTFVGKKIPNLQFPAPILTAPTAVLDGERLFETAFFCDG
jgi:hypothetical protein